MIREYAAPKVPKIGGADLGARYETPEGVLREAQGEALRESGGGLGEVHRSALVQLLG